MVKRMIIMLLGLGILFGGIAAFQSFKSHMMKKYMSAAKEAVTVTTIEAKNQDWQPKIKATGSLRAIQGVDVTTELAGLVKNIEFKPGTQVTKGNLLVKLNDDAEVAQLQVLLAAQEIARVTYERDKAQFAVFAVSQQTLDNDEATLKGAIAQVNQQKAVIDKKIIRAPFNGRLGISNVNPGQYVNPGDKIVTLQSLDPIYVDFYIPQQSLKLIKKGQEVSMTSDAYPQKTFKGKITTINPIIDAATRNVQIEATMNNPEQILLPGMFATVEVATGKPLPYLTLPQTAISFNPYGEIAYIVKEKTVNEKSKKNNNKPILIAEQTFVTVGETRGDQVAVLKGINPGDTVVTSGQLKLKNGSEIVINNTVVPSNNPNPKVVNE
ncbi:MAG: efflux RND transporter periplasmic adaptor subunit [Proteobacteria bacterium]|nr:efflux RND transporter periplasmic adaptor subunit [Pseudomonadota bacterium]